MQVGIMAPQGWKGEYDGWDPAAAWARTIELATQAAKAFPGIAPLRTADVLRWPGVLAEPSADEESTRGALDQVCRRALDDLCAARGREGAKLATVLRARVGEMRKRLAEALRQRGPK